jgi:hypothetical protein
VRQRKVLVEGQQTDPWLLYLYAMKSPATKEKYLIRLRKFLDFVNLDESGGSTLEAKARTFSIKGKNSPGWVFSRILDFMQVQKERFNRKEITAGTIRNYVKSIKLFCQSAKMI